MDCRLAVGGGSFSSLGLDYGFFWSVESYRAGIAWFLLRLALRDFGGLLVSFVERVHSVLLVKLASISLVIFTGQSIGWNETAGSLSFLFLGSLIPFFLNCLNLSHQLSVLDFQFLIDLLLLR